MGFIYKDIRIIQAQKYHSKLNAIACYARDSLAVVVATISYFFLRQSYIR